MRVVPLLLLVFVAVARGEPLVLRGATMGTTYHIKLPAPASLDTQQLDADIQAVLAEIDHQMSTYRPDSELSRFNAAPAGDWFPVSAAIAAVAAAAQSISEQSGGALDVTVNPLVKLWHFGPSGVSTAGARRRPFQPPADELIGAVRKRVGYRNLEVRLDPPALRKNVDRLEVDLSSIASGYAIDRLALLLDGRGLRDYMIELGGEVRAAGRRPDGKPWRVGIEWPLPGPVEVHSVPLTNAAIATAGDYHKFFEHAGRRYSHIIDPATGRPIENALASVTVVASSCLAADGWDTPLLVLGPQRGYDCAERHGIAALFISRDGGERGNEHVRVTSAWQTAYGMSMDP
jgi:thiamine biosynthesis lipoprotein